MAIDSRAIQQNFLSALQNITPTEDFQRGLLASQQRQQGDIQNQLLQQRLTQQEAIAPLQQQALQQGVDLKSIQIQQQQAALDALGVPDIPTAKQLAFNAAKLAALSDAEIPDQINRMIATAQINNRTTENLDELLSVFQQDPVRGRELLNAGIQAFQQSGLLDAPGGLVSAEQKTFESLIEDFTPEQKKEARLVKARLKPGAVGSAIQTIADKGIAEQIGDTEATISQRKKFGELTGSSRAKKIDSGFDSIVNIDKNIRNIDRAIAEIDEGASTGVIESRFFPSFKAATIKLEQVQKELGLDVISSVSFGALSEGELDLALRTALPTGLKPDKLKEFLIDKKEAQTKLRTYYSDQIDFLDQGGSVAGFLRQQERQGAQQQTTPSNVGRFQVEVLQ